MMIQVPPEMEEEFREVLADLKGLPGTSGLCIVEETQDIKAASVSPNPLEGSESSDSGVSGAVLGLDEAAILYYACKIGDRWEVRFRYARRPVFIDHGPYQCLASAQAACDAAQEMEDGITDVHAK